MILLPLAALSLWRSKAMQACDVRAVGVFLLPLRFSLTLDLIPWLAPSITRSLPSAYPTPHALDASLPPSMLAGLPSINFSLSCVGISVAPPNCLLERLRPSNCLRSSFLQIPARSSVGKVFRFQGNFPRQAALGCHGSGAGQ